MQKRCLTQKGEKGNRNEIEGKHILGITDEFAVAGVVPGEDNLRSRQASRLGTSRKAAPRTELHAVGVEDMAIFGD